VEGLFVVFAIVAAVLKIVAVSNEQKKKNAADKSPVSVPKTSEETSPIRAVRAQKREAVARAEEWRAAKHQQDDAEQVHSIRMDTCESKLESLRALYKAGILDREEYIQRVSRVKAKHYEA
jgi:hypothetical protein